MCVTGVSVGFFIFTFPYLPSFLVLLIFLTSDSSFIAGSAGARVPVGVCSKVPLVRPRGRGKESWAGPAGAPIYPCLQVCPGPSSRRVALAH